MKKRLRLSCTPFCAISLKTLYLNNFLFILLTLHSHRWSTKALLSYNHLGISKVIEFKTRPSHHKDIGSSHLRNFDDRVKCSLIHLISFDSTNFCTRELLLPPLHHPISPFASGSVCMLYVDCTRVCV